MNDVDFYEEVKILETAKQKDYRGMIGIVFGISYEDEIVYGYSIYIPDKGLCFSFKRNDFEKTGIKFLRSDFY